MSKESKTAVTVVGAVLLIAVLILCIGQCSRNGGSAGQDTKSTRVQGSGDANSPIVVSSNISLPSDLAEYLKSSTNNTIVINNTFQVPDGFAETLAANAERPKGFELRDTKRSAEELELAKKKAESDKKDAMAALFAINHINWVITKIKTYNDPAVLEEEYQGLTADALNLRVIKDPELIDLICRILDVIVEMRIEEKERAFLKDELDQGTSDALADAVSGIRITGLNPIAMVASAVTSVASAALNYKKAKRALQKKFERQNWSLDKNRMYYLNDLNKELLRDFWAIVQKYPDLPDEYRVSENNIQLLVDHLKDEDAKMRHEFLRAFNDQFAGFQPYWYHRAAAAYEVSGNSQLDEETRAAAREDARFSIERYMSIQIVCGNILRKDATAAKAALLRAAMMSEDGCKDKNAYQDAIDVVMRNSSPDDWQAAYFCALIAIRELKDVSLAEKILAPAISELDWQRRRRLAGWKNEMIEAMFEQDGTNKVDKLLSTGDALYECRTLIASTANLSTEEYQKRLSRICDDQNSSVREKMFCYGAMGYRQALEKLRPDVSRMRVYNRDGRYLVSVPFSWVIARGAEMALRVGDADRMEEGERNIEERDDGNQYVLIDYGEAVDGDLFFRSRFDRNGRDKNGRPETISYMVEVAFSGSGSELKPKKATFGRWEKGDGPASSSHWRMTEPVVGAEEGSPMATPHPDVETIDFNEH